MHDNAKEICTPALPGRFCFDGRELFLSIRCCGPCSVTHHSPFTDTPTDGECRCRFLTWQLRLRQPDPPDVTQGLLRFHQAMPAPFTLTSSPHSLCTMMEMCTSLALPDRRCISRFPCDPEGPETARWFPVNSSCSRPGRDSGARLHQRVRRSLECCSSLETSRPHERVGANQPFAMTPDSLLSFKPCVLVEQDFREPSKAGAMAHGPIPNWTILGWSGEPSRPMSVSSLPTNVNLPSPSIIDRPDGTITFHVELYNAWGGGSAAWKHIQGSI